MGSSCGKTATTTTTTAKEPVKNITIIVLGLKDAGKTSIIKVLRGKREGTPLLSRKVNSIKIGDPRQKKSLEKPIELIDIGWEDESYAETCSPYYKRVHGWIFVLDAADKHNLRDNASLIQELLNEKNLKSKPLLILANKADIKKSINNQRDIKRALALSDSLDYKIELCSALPQSSKQAMDPSISEGIIWLIDEITKNFDSLTTKEDNYTSDDQETPRRFRQGRSQRDYSEDEVEHNPRVEKRTRSHNEQLAPFRANFQSFPEEAPWLSNSTRNRKNGPEDLSTRFNSNSQVSSRSRKRDISPLVHDTTANEHYYADERKPTYSRFGGVLRAQQNESSDDDRATSNRKKTSRFSDDETD